MAITKTQRWLDLLAFLTVRFQPVPRSRIMDAVEGYAAPLREGTSAESVRRTFERDKDELQTLGIPLEVVDLPAEEPDEQKGYRLRARDFYLPYLRILEEDRKSRGEAAPLANLSLPRVEIPLEDLRAAAEGVALVRDLPDFPLVAEADSAFRKLTFDLGGEWSASGPVVARSDPREVSGHTEVISRAMEAAKIITFRYHGAYRGQETERTVEPYGLLFKFNRWYVVGRDVDRDAMRIFRLSRMTDLAMNSASPATPDFQRPDDFTLEPWREAEAWSLPEDEATPTEVTVRFYFPRSLWAERNDHGTLVDQEPGGVQLRRFTVHQADAFLRWLLTMLGEAEPVSPPEMETAFRTLAGSVAEIYQEASR